jgi:hypothetical protein
MTEDKEKLVKRLKVAFCASLMNANAGMKWLDHDSMDEIISAAWVGFEEPALSALEAIATPVSDMVERLRELARTAPDPRPMSAAMTEAADLIEQLASIRTPTPEPVAPVSDMVEAASIRTPEAAQVEAMRGALENALVALDMLTNICEAPAGSRFVRLSASRDDFSTAITALKNGTAALAQFRASELSGER